MPLPKIDQPLFNATLPSTGEQIKFRPFSVKEEKVLLIAQESKDQDQIVTAIKQILLNCVTSKTPVDQMSTFDIEYLLIQLRSKSVENIVEFKIKDDETEELVDVALDLDQVDIKRYDDHTSLIKLTDDIHMQMRYPTFDELALLLSKSSSQDAMYDVMVKCIDMIIQGDELHKLKDYTAEEVDTFIESLSKKHLTEIKKFFDTTPKVKHEIKYKNSKGNERTFVIEGLDAFFI